MSSASEASWHELTKAQEIGAVTPLLKDSLAPLRICWCAGLFRAAAAERFLLEVCSVRRGLGCLAHPELMLPGIDLKGGVPVAVGSELTEVGRQEGLHGAELLELMHMPELVGEHAFTEMALPDENGVAEGQAVRARTQKPALYGIGAQRLLGWEGESVHDKEAHAIWVGHADLPGPGSLLVGQGPALAGASGSLPFRPINSLEQNGLQVRGGSHNHW